MEKQQLEKYINEYGRDIYLFCKRLTQNKNTADDLYQETFLKLWELDNVNDTENPKSYLLGIAVIQMPSAVCFVSSRIVP